MYESFVQVVMLIKKRFLKKKIGRMVAFPPPGCVNDLMNDIGQSEVESHSEVLLKYIIQTLETY